MDAYTNGWKTRLNKLGYLVTTSLAAPRPLAEAASDSRSTTEPKASDGESSDYASSSFECQFDDGGNICHSSCVSVVVDLS